MEESGRASQEIAGLTEANSGETAPALTDSRFKLVLNDLTARILFQRALSRRRNKILDPFFLEGSRQLERFLARILFQGAEPARMMIFETVLFPQAEEQNKRGYGTARPDSRSGLILNDSVLDLFPKKSSTVS